MGLALLTAGAALQDRRRPFHYWTPDAYQGSPTPVTGYLSVGPKVAAFALILRLFVEALGAAQGRLGRSSSSSPRLTMTLGNLAALGQDNIKRMLAYSSIAHTGYIMVGLAAYGAAPDGSPAEPAGLQGVLFYSVAYAFMNLGAFAVRRRAPAPAGRDQPDLDASPGWAAARRCSALLMTLFLLSLTGIPPLAGFFAKASSSSRALEVGGWLTLLAVVHDAQRRRGRVLLPARRRLHVHARGARAAPAVSVGSATRAGLGVAAVATVAIGLIPPVTIAVIGAGRASRPGAALAPWPRGDGAETRRQRRRAGRLERRRARGCANTSAACSAKASG